MTPAIMEWGACRILGVDVFGRDVLEVGALNVNGTLRDIVHNLGPRSYVGTDLVRGGGVDVVARAEDLVALYGANSFDVVISTEMLEHAAQWREAVWNMKAVTRPGGLMFVTTRSPGFGYHPYPTDEWRFTVDDFQRIWGDFDIEDLIPDPRDPGVFIRARKPELWSPMAGAKLLALIEVARAPQG